MSLDEQTRREQEDMGLSGRSVATLAEVKASIDALARKTIDERTLLVGLMSAAWLDGEEIGMMPFVPDGKDRAWKAFANLWRIADCILSADPRRATQQSKESH